MTMDLGTSSKSVLFVENGLQGIRHYFVIIVALVASVKSVVSVANGLLEIQQWFAMNTEENVLNVEVMFRQLRLTRCLREASLPENFASQNFTNTGNVICHGR